MNETRASRATGSPATSGSTDGQLRARLWIGRNPELFVAACMALGFVVGAGVKS